MDSPLSGLIVRSGARVEPTTLTLTLRDQLDAKGKAELDAQEPRDEIVMSRRG